MRSRKKLVTAGFSFFSSPCIPALGAYNTPLRFPIQNIPTGLKSFHQDSSLNFGQILLWWAWELLYIHLFVCMNAINQVTVTCSRRSWFKTPLNPLDQAGMSCAHAPKYLCSFLYWWLTITLQKSCITSCVLIKEIEETGGSCLKLGILSALKTSGLSF